MKERYAGGSEEGGGDDPNLASAVVGQPPSGDSSASALLLTLLQLSPPPSQHAVPPTFTLLQLLSPCRHETWQRLASAQVTLTLLHASWPSLQTSRKYSLPVCENSWLLQSLPPLQTQVL